MNYGPLGFADYLRRNAMATESATVRAARAAQPEAAPVNLLRVISGPLHTDRVNRSADAHAVSVYEAVAMNPPGQPRSQARVSISVTSSERSLVMVLSSHQPVQWRLSVASGADVRALLLSGFGHSTVTGAQGVAVHRIGGFYAFRRGSVEYRHLESEVRRCTGHAIGHFQSLPVGDSLVL
ncbi:MAG TPA: hypothetical protein VM146_19645 [Steroidobacteraceae bacterium]|nr:hypothetical protein [Steroidobacteraceae bacterium]